MEREELTVGSDEKGDRLNWRLRDLVPTNFCYTDIQFPRAPLGFSPPRRIDLELDLLYNIPSHNLGTQRIYFVFFSALPWLNRIFAVIFSAVLLPVGAFLIFHLLRRFLLGRGNQR